MATGEGPNIVDAVYIRLRSDLNENNHIGMTQAALASLMNLAEVGQPRRSLSVEDCQAIADYLRENPILFENRTPLIIEFFQTSGGVTVIGLQ